MLDIRHTQGPEKHRSQHASAQHWGEKRQCISHPADVARVPYYTQAWGDLPPPWLRLPSARQTPAENPLEQQRRQDMEQGTHQALPIPPVNGSWPQLTNAAHLPLYTQAWGDHLPMEFAPISPKPSPTQEALPASDEPALYQENTMTSLPAALKAGIEHLSGVSLDEVQVHSPSEKPAQVQALAYTQGTEIHLGPGQGQHLAHEAWHVVQQKQGRVLPTVQIEGIVINDDPALEREAQVMAEKAKQVSVASQQAAEPGEREAVKQRSPGRSRGGKVSQTAPLQGYFVKNGQEIDVAVRVELYRALEATKPPKGVIAEFESIANDRNAQEDVDQWLKRKGSRRTFEQLLAYGKELSVKKITLREALLVKLNTALEEAKSQRNLSVTEPNIAYAQISIMTSDGKNITEKKIANSGKYSAEGTVKSPGYRYFETDYANGYKRDFDSEVKIFEELASQLGDNRGARGTVELYSNLPICSSCKGVIQQFQEYYTHVQVLVKKQGKLATDTNTDIVNMVYAQEALEASKR